MIKEIDRDDITECVQVVRKSFLTVAEEFGFTVENAPGFTAFATTEDNGFVHIGTEKFDFFPFTCGYMEREL